MNLRRLKWISVIAPVVFLSALDALRNAVEPDAPHSLPMTVLVAGIVFVGALLFAETLFRIIERLQAQLSQQNRELLALHQAGLGIAGELALHSVLQKVVDQARELVGAKYGALSVPAPGGGVESFVTSGITSAERASLGDPPVGHGLLGVPLREGQRLRLRDITQDPRAYGFPPNHPAMRSLLAVPVVSAGRILGNLYLAEKVDAEEFSSADEETLLRFATQAALAIENARLHHRVRDLAVTEERGRIAREMHDSLAQVLGYVNAKAEAIQELLRTGQPEKAQAQLAQLSGAARSAYADVREGILALRTTLGPERTLAEALGEYLQTWQDQTEVQARLEIDPPDARLDGLDPSAELQLLRIVQEALANVRKHARATQVVIRLAETERGLDVQVEDNGRGFDPAQLGSARFPRFGLSTMRERAEAVRGTLQLEARLGQGTRILVHLPRPSLALPLEPQRTPEHAGSHR